MVDQIGRVQPVAAGTNKQVDSVIEAQRTGTHPERLSALIAAPPFDAASFAKDPSAYMDQSVPSRAFQSAQPGKGIPVIQAVGSTQIDMKQDGEVILRVRTTPGMPATFSTFDLGRFGNSLTSQSVIADAHGIASVAYTPGPGTIAMVNILAASPAATGQVAFDINVTPASPAPAAH